MDIKSLYQKVCDFEKAQSPGAKILSQCKAGCSKCCYVDLSIFSIEADQIRDHFKKLKVEEKVMLKNQWVRPAGEACAFLVDEKCSIYEARPLICRTQGLAFKYKQEEKELIDICPLNEEMLDVLTTKEVLNLDLLNTILSQMEQAHPSRGPRQPLRELREELKNL